MATSHSTAQSKADQIERVEGMAEDRGDTWDLNKRDRAAIKAVLADRADLLASCKELVSAVSAAMRVIADLDAMKAVGAEASTREQRFVDELKISGVPNGFGVRAQVVIAKAEGGQ